MAPAQGWHAKSWSVPHFCVRTNAKIRLPLTVNLVDQCPLGRSFLGSISRSPVRSHLGVFQSNIKKPIGCAAGVVVSCKIPILATRVRFPGGAKFWTNKLCLWCLYQKVYLPDGESNPGLLRDRQGSLPLDYRGLVGCLRMSNPNMFCLTWSS